jgi:hypothetical protein
LKVKDMLINCICPSKGKKAKKTDETPEEIHRK